MQKFSRVYLQLPGFVYCSESRIFPLVQLYLQARQFDLTFSLRQRTVPTFDILLLVLGSDKQGSKWTHVDPPRRVTSSQNIYGM
jgi:hypothetical protein